MDSHVSICTIGVVGLQASYPDSILPVHLTIFNDEDPKTRLTRLHPLLIVIFRRLNRMLARIAAILKFKYFNFRRKRPYSQGIQLYSENLKLTMMMLQCL